MTGQSGSPAGTAQPGPDPNQLTINLTGVDNAQMLTVSLNGVRDTSAANIGNFSLPMGVLLGDTNADRAVNSGDATQTRNRSGQLTDGANFRSDVNTDGAINSGDAFIVRRQSGTAVSP